MAGRLVGVDTATCKARSKSSDARSKAGILLMGPEEDPKPLAAAWFRLSGLHSIPIRGADGHIMGLLGRPVSEDDITDGT